MNRPAARLPMFEGRRLIVTAQLEVSQVVRKSLSWLTITQVEIQTFAATAGRRTSRG
jgi:hypothetical protein